MKNLFTASILAISVGLFSCSNNSSSEEYNRAPAPGTSTDLSTPATGDATDPFAPAPAMDPAAYEQSATQQPVTQSNTKVEHYICPAGHVGGGGDMAGNCSVCGAELAHNDAFHNQPAQTNPTGMQPEITPANPSSTPSVTPVTEPAQNSSGVFHYICPEGHAGGSASPENCAVCGKQLVHNDKYHQ